MVKKTFILLIVSICLFIFVGCTTRQGSYELNDVNLDSMNKSVESFIKSKECDFTIVKDEENNIIELMDNSITESFIANQKLLVKLNGYKATKSKWEQKNNLILKEIEQYKSAMDTLGYKVDIKIVRCNEDNSKQYFSAVNGEVQCDDLFEYID